MKDRTEEKHHNMGGIEYCSICGGDEELHRMRLTKIGYVCHDCHNRSKTKKKVEKERYE